MESNIAPTTQDTQDTQYKQVTVDVPEERVAEFHAFFGRFLAARGGRRPGGRGRHLGHRHHGRGCGHSRERGERPERAEWPEPAERPDSAELGEGAEQVRPTVETTEL
jgi:hypothetical protein